MVARKHPPMNDVPALAVRGAPAQTQSGTHRRLLVRQVLEHPHPLLATICKEVHPTSAAVVGLANLLVATMRSHRGCVGLAAPQIGEHVRLFAVNVTGHPEASSCAGLIVLANPRIISRRGNMIVRERCASVPGLTGDVPRAMEVIVSGFVPGTGKHVVLPADGIEASCIQHEVDHLDGMSFLDRVVDPATDIRLDDTRR